MSAEALIVRLRDRIYALEIALRKAIECAREREGCAAGVCQRQRREVDELVAVLEDEQ